jgi:Lon protease-like protein
MSVVPRFDDLPATVHLLAVERFLLLPETILPLVLTDPGVCEIVESLEAEGGYLGFAQPRRGDWREEPPSPFYEVGCLGRIRSLERSEDGLHVTFEGVIRFRLLELLPPDGEDGLPLARTGYGEFFHDLGEAEEHIEGWDLEKIKAALLQIGQRQSSDDLSALEAKPPRQIIRMMAQTVPFAPDEKQALLEALTFRDLLELLFQLLAVNFLTTTPDASRPQVH